MLQLKYLLIEQGKSQRALAAELGIHESMISLWISERRPMPEYAAERIARSLSVPVAAVIQRAVAVPFGTDAEPIGTAA